MCHHVCLLDMTMCRAKMAETDTTEKLFGVVNGLGPQNHVLDGNRDPPWKEIFFFWGGENLPTHFKE